MVEKVRPPVFVCTVFFVRLSIRTCAGVRVRVCFACLCFVFRVRVFVCRFLLCVRLRVCVCVFLRVFLFLCVLFVVFPRVCVLRFCVLRVRSCVCAFCVRAFCVLRVRVFVCRFLVRFAFLCASVSLGVCVCVLRLRVGVHAIADAVIARHSFSLTDPELPQPSLFYLMRMLFRSCLLPQLFSLLCWDQHVCVAYAVR